MKSLSNLRRPAPESLPALVELIDDALEVRNAFAYRRISAEREVGRLAAWLAPKLLYRGKAVTPEWVPCHIDEIVALCDREVAP
jgi:hypothetical protein